jgi:hypothetical protein
MVRKEVQMTSKIRIKLGQIEVEYEGPEEFNKQELLGLIKTVSELSKTAGLAPLAAADSLTPASTGALPEKHGMQMSTSTIAAKTKSKKGPDLVLAAAASLAVMKNRNSFTRQEILEEMKTATGFFKTSYGGNLTVHLTGLVKSHKLLEISPGRYALEANTRTELESQLAG